MAHTRAITINLPTTGLTLMGAFVDTAGAIDATLRDVAATEIGGGVYRFSSAAFPDGARGTIVFYTGTLGAASDFSGVTVRAGGAINPEDGENADAKSSTLATPQKTAQAQLGVSGTVWHVSTTGNDTTGDGLTWATAYLSLNKAATVASAGDGILIGPGDFANTTTATIPAHVVVRGSGPAATVLRCWIHAGSGVQLRGFGLIDPTPGGVPLTVSDSATGVLIEDINVTGLVDCIAVGTDAAATLRRCHLSSGWDCIWVAGGEAHVYDSSAISVASNGDSNASAIVVTNGVLYMTNCVVASTPAEGYTDLGAIRGEYSSVYLTRVTIQPFSTSLQGSHESLDPPANLLVYLSDCVHDLSLIGDGVTRSEMSSGVDWARVGNPAATLNLSSTTIATASNVPSAATIADAILDEAMSGHTTAGTLGKTIADVLEDTGTTLPAAIADKTGYKLASDGLDSISVAAPTGVATNFRQMVVQLWRRFFKRAVYDRSAQTLKTYADDNTTVVTTQSLTPAGTVQSQGPAS